MRRLLITTAAIAASLSVGSIARAQETVPPTTVDVVSVDDDDDDGGGNAGLWGLLGLLGLAGLAGLKRRSEPYTGTPPTGDAAPRRADGASSH
jgi:MYXO-CTERM domain-containing protein